MLGFALWRLSSPNYQRSIMSQDRAAASTQLFRPMTSGHPRLLFSFLPSTEPRHPRCQPPCRRPSFPTKLQLALCRAPQASLLGMAWNPKPAPRSPLLQEACPDAPTYPRSHVSSQPPPAQLTKILISHCREDGRVQGFPPALSPRAEL